VFFTENSDCHMEPLGGWGGSEVNQRDCWIKTGRLSPTGMKFIIGDFLYA